MLTKSGRSSPFLRLPKALPPSAYRGKIRQQGTIRPPHLLWQRYLKVPQGTTDRAG